MMKYGVVLIILLCVIIYRITLMRNVEADVFTNMYAYIAGCMPLLTLHLNDAISSLRTYGAMSLNGFVSIFLFLIICIYFLILMLLLMLRMLRIRWRYLCHYLLILQ